MNLEEWKSPCRRAWEVRYTITSEVNLFSRYKFDVFNKQER